MVLTMLSNRARLRAAVAEAVEKAVAEAVAEAVPRAVEEHNRLWREWNERREAAAREGREFTESPPDLPRGTTMAPEVRHELIQPQLNLTPGGSLHARISS